ncbi:uncharacterized protein VTP21DRAFT_6834 [Calcarisporiella thermophila]|uniref:uncharacterized protein n=1 Tax=Calcarisporiella thermophila TaxID=911321 RepID=UPI0037439FD1
MGLSYALPSWLALVLDWTPVRIWWPQDRKIKTFGSKPQGASGYGEGMLKDALIGICRCGRLLCLTPLLFAPPLPIFSEPWSED